MTGKKKIAQDIPLPIILTIVTGIYLDIEEARARGATGPERRAVGRKQRGVPARSGVPEN